MARWQTLKKNIVKPEGKRPTKLKKPFWRKCVHCKEDIWRDQWGHWHHGDKVLSWGHKPRPAAIHQKTDAIAGASKALLRRLDKIAKFPPRARPSIALSLYPPTLTFRDPNPRFFRSQDDMTFEQNLLYEFISLLEMAAGEKPFNLSQYDRWNYWKQIAESLKYSNECKITDAKKSKEWHHVDDSCLPKRF